VAGHSKWHNIKHRKAAVDKKRGKVWTKCSKAIIVAAKIGGPDPASNLTLRYAIDEARYANMPRDTIERAIKKGAGELEGQSYETIRYEGYGPGGAALIVDALTDNRTRTVGDVRLVFGKFGGNIGSTGCVGYMFAPRGQIVLTSDEGVSEDRVMDAVIEAGAEDVEAPESEGDPWVILTTVPDFLGVKERLEAAGKRAGFTIAEAGLAMIPSQRTTVHGEDARKLASLVEALEDNDDVQKVYTNADIPPGELD
jgi:YebC/PmpR family DNA-binding regulatory protein